ncbi:hypothetical protein Sru01_47170 [Sphaerisporangium rufum]|uniref:Uncharacterized protein n=1 Tax=Sphaerisporangium rufum TaxID=1381558 RepID=A0A919R7N5_9ACTN|nr:hypothetical protein Sru01_47170 [Sphaerisporangium rufum]
MALLPSPGPGRGPAFAGLWQAYAVTAVTFFGLTIVAAALDLRGAATICMLLCGAFTVRFALHYANRRR